MFTINELFCYFPNPLDEIERELPSAKFIDYGHHVKINKEIYFIKIESNEELFTECVFWNEAGNNPAFCKFKKETIDDNLM